MRKILVWVVITLLVICLGLYWYFFQYPKPFSFNSLPPRNYSECVKAGGATVNGSEDPKAYIFSICTYKSKEFKITNTY